MSCLTGISGTREHVDRSIYRRGLFFGVGLGFARILLQSCHSPQRERMCGRVFEVVCASVFCGRGRVCVCVMLRIPAQMMGP